MQNNGQIRGLAILTGSVLAASALIAPAPARADKADNLKIGATVLGGAAAILAAKGKTLPAAIAGAAGYYAYKKGRDADRKKNDYPYAGNPAYGQYPQYPGNNYPTSGYPTSGNYPSNYPTYGSDYPVYGNYPTYGTDYPTNNYPSNSYPSYNQPTNYPSGSYGGNNTDCRDGRNTGYNGNYNGSYNGSQRGYNGGYNGGYNQYPDSFRAVAPKSAAPAPRSNQQAPVVVLR
jgi:hypothetical protein